MKIKKIIALLLAAAFAFTPLFFAHAEEKEEYTADCPYIYIHGFMGANVYRDPSDPDSDPVFPPTGDEIFSAVKGSLWPLVKLIFTHNWKAFGEKVIPIVTDMFSPSFLGPDGEVTDKSDVRWSYPERDEIKKDSQLSFVYDWRKDPIETAAKLNDFINYVLECSGSEQVVLECHSYGGVVTNTYARLYGTDKVKSWCFNSTAVFGETYTGELFTGNLKFDAESLTAYLDGTFEFNKSEKFLDFLFKALYKTGITGAACKLVNKGIDKIGMKELSKGILPMFGGWLSIWSMVPDDKIDESMDFVFNQVYGDDPTDRSGLKEKVDNYNTLVRPYKMETLEKISETSNLYVIARYGFSSMFMTPSWRNCSDNTIDLKYASFGASGADYGKTLTDDYIAKVDNKYISPDKVIDASTCKFPEQTWFIRHASHALGSRDMDIMIKTWLYTDGQATVDTYKQYPRFLYYNDDGTIVPDVK